VDGCIRMNRREAAVGTHDQIRSQTENPAATTIADKVVADQVEPLNQLQVEVQRATEAVVLVKVAGQWVERLESTEQTRDFDMLVAARGRVPVEGNLAHNIRMGIWH